jgi:hypothetical protein
MTCSQCGAQTPDTGQKFCGNCGAKLGGAGAGPAATAISDPAAAAKPVWPSPAAAKKGRRINKPIVIAAIAALIVILAGGGFYFAMTRPSDTQEIAGSDQPIDQPAEPAAPADVPPQEETPPSKTPAAPAKPPAPRERRSAPGDSYRSAGVAGIYEVVRDTSVYEDPSDSSRIVASIRRGVTVNVLGASGNWLEVRSTSGRPPGFIRRSDALPSPKQR